MHIFSEYCMLKLEMHTLILAFYYAASQPQAQTQDVKCLLNVKFSIQLCSIFQNGSGAELG